VTDFRQWTAGVEIPDYGAEAKAIMLHIWRMTKPPMDDLRDAFIELTQLQSEIMSHVCSLSGETQQYWIAVSRENAARFADGCMEVLRLARFFYADRFVELLIGLARSPVLAAAEGNGVRKDYRNEVDLIVIMWAASNATRLVPTLDRHRIGELREVLREKGVRYID